MCTFLDTQASQDEMVVTDSLTNNHTETKFRHLRSGRSPQGQQQQQLKFLKQLKQQTKNENK